MNPGNESRRFAAARGDWLRQCTRIDELAATVFDDPAKGLRAWLQTTAGIVAVLLALQFATGVLLSFYYLPSTDHAYTTVLYIEKVLPAGSWIRAVHHYGSQWLTLFLVLHVVQLFWRLSYQRRTSAWLASVALLALVMAAGGTGYSLPWDARAFFSTRIAEGIAGGLPLIGKAAHGWLLGGTEISTLTLSRFFALHVFVIPALILIVINARLFIFRPGTAGLSADSPGTAGLSPANFRFLSAQVTRNAVSAGLVFFALALYAKRFYAPLGPPASALTPGYLPRPGAQFIWLYQFLKYVPGRVGSLFAVGLPAIILGGLGLLPFLNLTPLRRYGLQPARFVGIVLLAVACVLVATLTTAAYLEDRRDPHTRQQLARQAADEAVSRNDTFVPTLLRADEDEDSSSPRLPISASPHLAPGPPQAYTQSCAVCHGEHGEGARQGPLKFPALLGVSAKPRRTAADVIGILNDPKAYGLEPPMKSFARKLTEDEKRQIAEWVVTLKK